MYEFSKSESTGKKVDKFIKFMFKKEKIEFVSTFQYIFGANLLHIKRNNRGNFLKNEPYKGVKLNSEEIY